MSKPALKGYANLPEELKALFTLPIEVTEPNDHGVWSEATHFAFLLPGKAHAGISLALTEEARSGGVTPWAYGYKVGAGDQSSGCPCNDDYVAETRYEAVIHAVQDIIAKLQVNSHKEAEKALMKMEAYERIITQAHEEELALSAKATAPQPARSYEVQMVAKELLVDDPRLERVSMVEDVLKNLKALKVKKERHGVALEELDEDNTATQASLDEHGIIEPLKIYRGDNDIFYVADGRHRKGWALSRDHVKTVPCTIITPEEATAIIEGTVTGRRHWTKGMKAYMAVLMHPEVVASSQGRNWKKSNCYSVAISEKASIKTRTELAMIYGVSRPLIDQACDLYEQLEASPTLREKHEWRVFADFGLGAIIAGLAGDERTEKAIKESELIKGIFTRLNKFGGSIKRDWERYGKPKDRNTIAEGIASFLEKLPADLRSSALAKLTNA
jgi:hypothetical protein